MPRAYMPDAVERFKSRLGGDYPAMAKAMDGYTEPDDPGSLSLGQLDERIADFASVEVGESIACR